MHALLALSSVLLVALGGFVLLAAVRRVGGPQRRPLQVLVLATPLVSLGLGLAGLLHFARRDCFLAAPVWDAALGAALPVGMALVGLGGLALGLGRHVLRGRAIARGRPAGPALQSLSEELAERLGAPRPRLLVCTLDRPLALTYGLRRPKVLLSTWMLERLDAQELESVLAHELAHATRRDYLAVWLATVLRDAFCYLPTSWAAYRQLQREKEPTCDDLAIGATRRPLALASALAKVWNEAAGGGAFAAAPSLSGPDELIEDRIERLMGPPPQRVERPRPRAAVLAIGAAGLAELLGLQAVTLALLLLPMGCGPLSASGMVL